MHELGLHDLADIDGRIFVVNKLFLLLHTCGQDDLLQTGSKLLPLILLSPTASRGFCHTLFELQILLVASFLGRMHHPGEFALGELCKMKVGKLTGTLILQFLF